MKNSTNYRAIMSLMSVVFFMWGALTCLNDLLVPHLKDHFHLNYTEAMLVQFCFFFTYALASIPASRLVARIGYKRGMLIGSLVCAVGCLFFIAASHYTYYAIFLLGLFILAAGIVCLQVAANPFVTLLGAPEQASSRLTFVQALNSLGTTIVPLVLGSAIIGGAIKTSYLGIVFVLVVFIILIALARFPSLVTIHDNANTAQQKTSLLHYPSVILGAIAIFVYVGTEVSASSLLVNYLHLPSIANMAKADAAHYLSRQNCCAIMP
jgi:FHS family L-fucose permease-like MFS transporter